MAPTALAVGLTTMSLCALLHAVALPEGARNGGAHVIHPQELRPIPKATEAPAASTMLNVSSQGNASAAPEKDSQTGSSNRLLDFNTLDSAEVETNASLHLFLVIAALGSSLFLIYWLAKSRWSFLPDSVAVIALGALIAVVFRFDDMGWERAEAFDPTVFFLYLLPPIIFESGYSLQRGAFFSKLGTILIFAVIGTILSTIVVGGGFILLMEYGYIPNFGTIQVFAFGSLISAVDPVATLAIFQALDIDASLYMLVFGESVLNDAVSIVLTRSIIEIGIKHHFTSGLLYSVFWEFIVASVGSALIGVLAGFLCALVTKHLDLFQLPAVEFAFVCIFAYLPYLLAEGWDLSGIMAILFAGITTAHYAHGNLSPTTKVTVKQAFRTTALLAETAVFLYIGMALFSFRLDIRVDIVCYSLLLCLLGRAANIFSLSMSVNVFANAQISSKHQFIMWFSGLRGAIAFALALHLPLELFDVEVKNVFVSTTLMVVLCTIVLFGCSTMPLLQCLRSRRKGSGSKSPTRTASQDAEEPNSWLVRVDTKYLQPLLRRRGQRLGANSSEQEQELHALTEQWQQKLEELQSESTFIRSRISDEGLEQPVS
ncbi:uncharacterized protein MONBRDRAFT_32693 [Monosiga brevicollis MX1]|uniref:Sodium/hydrogen exchanger n=1 Tax=Monosiga brevicollis TaxID=81824 RepID=A9V154_MONBE|nr:uncharacterized protein MONBRDRAFT_32693 [Monosiga brevicollis MX1]EDQ88748.1 predicted protein [Monosiga brevicollis MX1]|eukprot:XP_001746361.1 hypothetical protein [Monosiga brevicollis MX1]